jgi:hypothetical protein
MRDWYCVARERDYVTGMEKERSTDREGWGGGEREIEGEREGDRQNPDGRISAAGHVELSDKQRHE